MVWAGRSSSVSAAIVSCTLRRPPPEPGLLRGPFPFHAGEYDAIILASAGLRRLGKTELVRELLPIEVMCPAAGQGALAIETRTADQQVCGALAFLDDATARAETDCERALLKALGGGCQVPIGANARVQGGMLHLDAVVASPDGKLVLRKSAAGNVSKSLAARRSA